MKKLNKNNYMGKLKANVVLIFKTKIPTENADFAKIVIKANNFYLKILIFRFFDTDFFALWVIKKTNNQPTFNSFQKTSKLKSVIILPSSK